MLSSRCVTAQDNFINEVKGKVIDSVFCLDNLDQSYALYLPSYYSSEKSWPIIFIFEPAARGALPVKIYQQSAEELGYIIVSSNNSRNGSWERVFDAADAMLLDTQTRFNLNLERFYTSGFSGGARAAIAVSTVTGSIRGIIGCGAGNATRPDLSIKKREDLVYVGIVGDRDMNYLEHQDFELHLNQLGIENLRLVTHDKHQWPSAKMISLAMYWLELKTNDSLSPDRRNKIETAFSNYVMEQQENGEILEAVRNSGYLKRDFNLEPDANLQSAVLTKEYAKEVSLKQKAEKREKQVREYHEKAFAEIPTSRLVRKDSLKDAGWWNIQIKKWKKKTTSDNPYVVNSSLRILNQIWARCAETSFKYEAKQDYELALRLNEIWLLVEPESIWALWSRARLYALNGQPDEAIDQLIKANAQGSITQKGLAREPAFKDLSTSPKFESFKTTLK